MTVQEMHIGVSLGVQKVNAAAFDTLIPEEINYYLNKALREYIRRQSLYLRKELQDNRYDEIGESGASYNLGALLSNHLYTGSDITPAVEYTNAIKVSLEALPVDMFDFVYGQAKYSDQTDWKACMLISSSKIHIYSKTGYNDPVFRRLPVVIIGNNLYVFYDSEGDGVDELSLLYVKSPSRLVTESPQDGEVTTCELPSKTHDEIVDLAVAMITEDIKSVRPYEQNQNTIKGTEA